MIEDNCAHEGPAHLAAHDQAHAAVRNVNEDLDCLIQSYLRAVAKAPVQRETSVIGLARGIHATHAPEVIAELLAVAITRLVSTGGTA